MKNISENQFGLSGRVNQEYNNFLGRGKAGKRNRALRVEKRKLKNEERRVATERARAEAQLIQQMAEPAAAVTSPAEPAVQPEQEEESFVSEPSKKDGSAPKGKKPIVKIAVITAVGLLLLGIGILAIRQRNTVSPRA